jgi:BA14K-like protein
MMKKTIVSLLGAATIVVMVAVPATDASAQWRGRGWGWGPGIAAGIVGGAVIAGAIIASRPPGYVVYPGYSEPVYAPGCYWASRPIYDGAGRVVGYTGRPVQVCPGYSAPPPGNAGGPPPGNAGGPPPGNAGGPPPGYAGGPPPGYAGGPPPGYAGGPPPGYAGGPPAGDPVASCMQRFRSYDPQTGTYLGNDGQRHSCP